MNIGVLGASFDPPHNGHLAILKNVLKSQKAQKIILMPTHIHPFEKKLTPASNRLKMVSFLKDKNIEISDYEIKKDSTSYSIETLQFLQKKFPQDRLYWIIGADNLKDFIKWKEWQKILSDFGLIVVPRKESFKNVFWTGQNGKKNIVILNAEDFPPFDISSSEIRQRVKAGKTINNLVPKEVEKYIIEHKLYISLSC